MAQEQFAGPEYVTEFDPEKFLRELAAQEKARGESQGESQEKTGDEEQGGAVERTE